MIQCSSFTFYIPICNRFYRHYPLWQIKCTLDHLRASKDQNTSTASYNSQSKNLGLFSCFLFVLVQIYHFHRLYLFAYITVELFSLLIDVCLLNASQCLPLQETWVQFLGQEDPLKQEMATHSSIPTWAIPWTAEPGESMGLQRVRYD